MATNNLTIRYRREGTTYSGELWDGTQFSGWEFRKIIGRIHERMLAIIAIDTPSVTFIRSDLKIERPYRLEEALCQLIKTDPVAAVRFMSPNPVTIRIRDNPPVKRELDRKSTEPQELTGSILVVGHDVLADTFGYWVYTSRIKDRSKAECLVCGRWASLEESGELKVLNCQECGAPPLLLELANDKWLRLKTTELINFATLSGLERLFIPRNWGYSMGGPWVDVSRLAEKYTQFKKEKSYVCND